MNNLLDTILSAIDDRKGNDIKVIDLRGTDGAITSWFVICSADSTTQVSAIAAGVEERTQEELGEKVWRTEGLGNSIWAVMDYGDVVVHIFQTGTREFYKLEQLWADAPSESYRQTRCAI